MESRVATALATVPQPCRVLGTALRPFCLGHLLLFKRLGIPFAAGHDAEATTEDMLIGIAICAASYEETLEALHDGSWPDVFRRWRKDVMPWCRLLRRPNMQRVEKMFREHIRNGLSKPPLFEHLDNTGVEMSAPWEQLLKCVLVGAGFSETEVFNGYLPQRWYDYFTILEIGQARNLTDPKKWRPTFYTNKDDALIEAAKKGAS